MVDKVKGIHQRQRDAYARAGVQVAEEKARCREPLVERLVWWMAWVDSWRLAIFLCGRAWGFAEGGCDDIWPNGAMLRVQKASPVAPE